MAKYNEYLLSLYAQENYIDLSFCPWCGKKNPKSLIREWHGRLEELGYDFNSGESIKKIPMLYQSDEWWKNDPIALDITSGIQKTHYYPNSSDEDECNIIYPSSKDNIFCCSFMRRYIEDDSCPMVFHKHLKLYSISCDKFGLSLPLLFCPWCGRCIRTTTIKTDSEGYVMLPPKSIDDERSLKKLFDTGIWRIDRELRLNFSICK
jgi:hypothetical protein